MSRILSVNESGKVILSSQGQLLPEFKALKANDHTSGKKYYENALKLIFFLFDRDSMYADMGYMGRLQTVHNDMFKDTTIEKVSELVDSAEIQIAVKRLNALQYTPSERHLKKCEEKFEQFQELYSDTPVSHDNYEKIAKELRGTSSLYEVMDNLTKKVIKEITEQGVGDYKPALFESVPTS
jgi:hypothetical protein